MRNFLIFISVISIIIFLTYWIIIWNSSFLWVERLLLFSIWGIIFVILWSIWSWYWIYNKNYNYLWIFLSLTLIILSIIWGTEIIKKYKIKQNQQIEQRKLNEWIETVENKEYISDKLWVKFSHTSHSKYNWEKIMIIENLLDQTIEIKTESEIIWKIQLFKKDKWISLLDHLTKNFWKEYPYCNFVNFNNPNYKAYITIRPWIDYNKIPANKLDDKNCPLDWINSYFFENINNQSDKYFTLIQKRYSIVPSSKENLDIDWYETIQTY
jgi:hypothetical protein